MQKYSRRERRRAKDFMHKLIAKIARRLREANSGAIVERLKGIKHNILNGSRKQNRKLSKWNARTFQFMLDYKLKWLELPVKYVDAKNTSKTCPLCSGSLASYGGRLMKCRDCSTVMDREGEDLNLQMPAIKPPVHWNPFTTGSYFGPEGLVVEPLAFINLANWTWIPWLAESWSLSEDGLTLTVNLRRGMLCAHSTAGISLSLGSGTT